MKTLIVVCFIILALSCISLVNTSLDKDLSKRTKIMIMVLDALCVITAIIIIILEALKV